LVETELQKIAKKSEYWYGSGTWSSVHINQENLMEEVAFPRLRVFAVGLCLLTEYISARASGFRFLTRGRRLYLGPIQCRDGPQPL
jgi:hypothetical protein